MRLIDADAMRARVTNDWARDEEHGHEYGTACFYIDTQPTIDAQEVVRCKDCIHRDPEDKKCDVVFCAKNGLFPMDDNDYCSCGDRKGW